MTSLKIKKHKSLETSLTKRIDSFPHNVPNFLSEHDVKFIKSKILPIKTNVNIFFNYSLSGRPIAKIHSKERFRNIDVNIDINKEIKSIPHKLRILQTYSLATSLFDIKKGDLNREKYLYKLKAGNNEIDNFLVDFLVPKDKFSIALSRTRCPNTLARLFNVNERVIQYRLQKN